MTTDGNYELRILEFSDVHVDGSLVPTRKILGDMDKMIPDDAKTAMYDIVFIAGDFWDKEMSAASNNCELVDRWIVKFLRRCKVNGTIVRVLEGTKSHDRGQNYRFIMLNELANIGANVGYWDVLAIEHIKELDIDVLYLPDQWRHDPDETWVDVQNLIASKGLKKVDYAITHGFFEHQVPEGLGLHPHLNKRYRSIVRKYIFNGHHHTAVVKDNIIVAGSPGRYMHGQEEDKGIVAVTVRHREKNDNDTIRFIKNEYATVFNSYHWEDKDSSEVAQFVEEIVKLPPGSHVRIYISRLSENLAVLVTASHLYRHVTWNLVPPKKKKGPSVKEAVKVHRQREDTVVTKVSISSVIEERLTVSGVSPSDVSHCIKELEMVIG